MITEDEVRALKLRLRELTMRYRALESKLVEKGLLDAGDAKAIRREAHRLETAAEDQGSWALDS